MPKFIDLTGQRFGRLVVVERGPDAMRGRCGPSSGSIKITPNPRRSDPNHDHGPSKHVQPVYPPNIN